MDEKNEYTVMVGCGDDLDEAKEDLEGEVDGALTDGFVLQGGVFVVRQKGSWTLFQAMARWAGDDPKGVREKFEPKAN